MKKTRKLLIIFGSVIFLLFGCNKDEDINELGQEEQVQDHDHDHDHEGHDHDHDHDHSSENIDDKDLEIIAELEKKTLAELDFGKCKDVEFKENSFVQICNYAKELQSIEEVKSMFPHIENIDTLDSYSIEKIYIRIDEATAKKIEEVRSWTEFDAFNLDLTKDKKNYIHLAFNSNEYPLLENDKLDEIRYNENTYEVLNPRDSHYEGIFTQRLVKDKNIYILASNYNIDQENSYIEVNEFIRTIDKYFHKLLK